MAGSAMILLAFIAVAVANPAPLTHTAKETEMFAIPISPNLFNWTYQEFDQQYRFHASLLGKPELPPWLRYIYSGRHHSGFIFGTPPRGTEHPVTLEVIGLNRQDYETRRIKIILDIKPKENMALHEVELKIDNLNVEDLLDEHRMTRLKDILRTKLWTESNKDLYATFLASAIDMGARLPLKPEDGEGLVVRLGSSKPLSSELKSLREEVRPLSKLVHCPREYKRTTVERLFRDAGLTLDWCSFELYNTIYESKSTVHLEYLSEIPDSKTPSQRPVNSHDVWTAPSRHNLPTRGYGKQITIAVAIPICLAILTIGGLTVVVCFHYATIAHKSDKVEMCRYNNETTEQTQVPDDTSNKSIGVSPNNSLLRPYSPKSTTNLAGNYNRPQPPPYVSTSSLHHRKSIIDKPTALEESLKLLNEANISKNTPSEYKSLPSEFKNIPSEFKNIPSEFKNIPSEFKNIPSEFKNIPSEFKNLTADPIVDLNDGSDDYVPVKIDGYVPMKAADLDDIEVPDLTKYMGVGI